MSVRTHHFAALLFAGAIFMSTMAVFSVYTPTAIAACGTGAAIGINTPAQNATLSGTVALMAQAPATPTPNGVTFVISSPMTQPIGEGIIYSTSPPTWKYMWNTATVPNGDYQISAIAHYPGGSAYDCPSAPVAIRIHNGTATAPTPTPTPTPATSGTTEPSLLVKLSPVSAQISPGGKVRFNAQAYYTASNGTTSSATPSNGATVIWESNAGGVAPNGMMYTDLTAGPKLGEYVLAVTVKYNGLTKKIYATVKVMPPDQIAASPTPSGSISPRPTPSPTPGPASDSSAGDDALPVLTEAETKRLESTPTIFRPTVPTNAKPLVAAVNLSCLEHKLGERYARIAAGTETATVRERMIGARCFSGTAKIPASIAPVEPTRIEQVPTTTTAVTLAGLKNQVITNAKGDKIPAILVEGTAAPETDVYVYIFSDPMVLRAKSDKAGKWNYVLQNPLKPGQHEVYAVTAKDSESFVRTSALPVSIAAAAGGSQDGSLIIESRWRPEQMAYVGAAVLMVMIGIFLLLRLRRSGVHLGGMVHPGSGPEAEMIHPTITTTAPQLARPTENTTPGPKV